MIKTLFLIPVADNAGNFFAQPDWEMLETRLLAFGGFSVRADVAGVWQAQYRVYRDTSREYTVALTSWWQLPAWLATVEWAQAHFRQFALYVEIAGIPEIYEP